MPRRIFSLLAALLLLPNLAFAHAILVRSNPANHATLAAGKPLPIELHFNSRVDGARSRITLTLTSDTKAEHPIPIRPTTQPAPDTLTTSTEPLTKGDYTLHWIALASDGHISRGEVLFSVR